ncbi:hypothetical protein ACE6H2_028565 [Prunus campanulata]
MNITVENAYRRSIETVVDWIGSEVNTSKTYVLFRTYAPVHFSKLAVDVTEAIWNSGGGCHMEALPDLGSLPVLPHSPIVMTIFDVLSEQSNESHVRKLDLLNVCPNQEKRWTLPGVPTRIKTAATGAREWPENGQPLSSIKTAATGVPDSWNELLYALFLKHESHRTSS